MLLFCCSARLCCFTRVFLCNTFASLRAVCTHTAVSRLSFVESFDSCVCVRRGFAPTGATPGGFATRGSKLPCCLSATAPSVLGGFSPTSQARFPRRVRKGPFGARTLLAPSFAWRRKSLRDYVGPFGTVSLRLREHSSVVLVPRTPSECSLILVASLP